MKSFKNVSLVLAVVLIAACGKHPEEVTVADGFDLEQTISDILKDRYGLFATKNNKIVSTAEFCKFDLLIIGETEENEEIKLVTSGMEKTGRFLFKRLVYAQISTNVSNPVLDKPCMTAYEDMSINGKGISAKREFYSKGADYKMIVNNYLGDTKMNFVWLMKRELADGFSDQLNELIIKSGASGSNTTVDFVQTDSLNVGNGEELPPPPDSTETMVNEAEVFQVVEEMPEFPGGENALLEFIAKNLVYPKEAKENGVSGKVYIQFVVMKDGKVTNIKVLRGLDPSLDAASVNVIKKLPVWKPGKQKGKPVNVSYTVPIKFELE